MITFKKFFIPIILLIHPAFVFGQGNSININTNFVEDAPALSTDGNTMIFQSNREGAFKLYESKLQKDGKWSDPKSIEEINSTKNSFSTICGPSITHDGNYLFFSAITIGEENNMDIYFSRKIEDHWSTPQNIGTPVNSIHYDGYPSISADGEKLFFTRLLSKGKNCFNIFVSEKSESGLWKEPIPLPIDINAGCPKSPRILSDGKTLLYCSRSDRGKNNFDLYRSVLTKEGNWSSPIPFEFANSIGSEEFGTITELNEHMYYVTGGDIYSIEITPEIILNKIELSTLDSESKKGIKAAIQIRDSLNPTTIIKIDSSDNEGKFQTILLPGKKYLFEISANGYISQSIYLNFLHNENFKRINKKLELKKDLAFNTSVTENIESHSIEIPFDMDDINEEALLQQTLGRDGKYSVNLREGNTYNIQVSAKKSRSHSMIPKVLIINSSAEIVTAIYDESIGDFSTKKQSKDLAIKMDSESALKNIYFGFNSFELQDSSYHQLNNVIELLTENPSIKLEIIGHTDNVGSNVSNRNLSMRRAQTIVAYLVNKGTDASRLKTVGLGKGKPIASNDTESGRAKNRRAELKIIETK